jgi:glycosyltransferase involved in cell wall biosynthesis
MKLSIVIPSYHDPFSVKTIKSILENSELGNQLEVIQVLDGYWQDFEIIQDPRVRYVHLGANRGMRGAINAGILVSRGEFFMRLDEHCSFGKGFDRIMTESCLPNQIMTARRYYLDPIKWEIMENEGYVDCEKLVIQDMGNGVRKFSGQKWASRAKEMKDVPIIESQAMQGSMWIMPRKWFDEVCGGELEVEGYGVTYQDSVEVSMKTWKAGGSLVVNKNTWFAHKHRSFSRTHNEGSPENPSKREASWAYSLKVWEDFYKELQVKWTKQ